jgi:hypothetical protein
LLGQWSELVRHWEADLTAPTKVALSQRMAIRQEIADYKTCFALHEPEPDRTAG